MTQDTAKTSIFARLDTDLLRETSKLQEPRKMGTQESRNPSPQLPRKPGTWEDGNVASQETRKPGSQEHGKRANYPQQTYNIHPDVIDLLEDTKRDLRRRYNIKTSKEILAEEAIRLLCVDFQQRKDDSTIVHILNKTPGNQEDGNPGTK